MSQRRTLRSASRQPLQPSHSNSHATLVNEVIVLSSDDEDLPVPKKRARRTTTQTTAARTVARTPANSPEELIEISSDDDIPLKTTSNPVTALEMENKALKEELARLRRQQKQAAPLSVASEELRMVEAHKKLLHALDDPTSCEICTMRMWSPYLLGCGHAFCQTCLQDWFKVALNKHMAENPTYEQNTRALAHYYEVLRTPRLAAHERRYVEEHIRTAQGNIPQPIYTCPTCRNTVKDKPAEDYGLKAVVRAVAETTGESSPKKVLPPRGSKEAGPWDRFFPMQ